MAKKNEKAKINLDQEEFSLLWNTLQQSKKTSKMMAQKATKEQKQNLKANLKIMKRVGSKLEEEGKKLGWI